MAQRVVAAAAAAALLLAPPALAFGPVSVKLDEIVVKRVDCAGGRVCDADMQHHVQSWGWGTPRTAAGCTCFDTVACQHIGWLVGWLVTEFMHGA